MILALGPEHAGITLPFRLFHDYIPGFGNIRAIPRLVMPAMLTGAVLASIGLAWLTRRLRGGTACAVAIGVGALMLLEFAAPVHRVELPTDQATLAVYRELAGQPSGAVVELPLAGRYKPRREWPFVEAPRMVYGTIDWHPRVNGYSGSSPRDYVANIASLNSFPSPASLDTARRLKLRYVVLHTGRFAGYPQYTNAQARAIVATLPKRTTAKRYGNSWLVDLNPQHSGAPATARPVVASAAR